MTLWFELSSEEKRRQSLRCRKLNYNLIWFINNYVYTHNLFNIVIDIFLSDCKKQVWNGVKAAVLLWYLCASFSIHKITNVYWLFCFRFQSIFSTKVCVSWNYRPQLCALRQLNFYRCYNYFIPFFCSIKLLSVQYSFVIKINIRLRRTTQFLFSYNYTSCNFEWKFEICAIKKEFFIFKVIICVTENWV